MGSLSGRIALITGSTAGIGRELAKAFAEAGADVWVHGRTRARGEEIANDIGGRFVEADLATSEGAEHLARDLSAQGRLDILVNNAGIELPMPVEDLSLPSLDLMWQVNFRSPVQLMHLLLPLLKVSSAASVINVTSIHERVPYAQNSIYSATKAALAMFTKAAAIELAPEGIRVNNLAPGAVETEMNREVLDTIGRERFASWIPAGRVGAVADVVGPALFLASDASKYVTGTTLTVDGGYSEHLVRYRPLN